MAPASEVEVQTQLPPSVLTPHCPHPGNFSVPVYIRTCHRPSCIIKGTSSPWTNIDLQGSCCDGHLCNRDSVAQPFTTASATAPAQAPLLKALLLMVPLLLGTLGGPLMPLA